MEFYARSVEVDDTNEYSYSNISLIALKKGDYNRCIEYCNKALEIINGFQNDTKASSNDNKLEVKLLLRRGKSLELTGDYEGAKRDLDECVRLEPHNGEARNILKKFLYICPSNMKLQI